MADDLFSILQQVDPKTLQKMVDAGLFDERSAPLQQQLSMGKNMMATPMATGQNVGNTYVAASPLEHIANAVRQAYGARQTSQAIQGENALADQRGQGRLAYLKLLAQQGQPPQPMPGTPPMPAAPPVDY